MRGWRRKGASTEIDSDLLQAQGLALALVGAALERDHIVAEGEFGRLLGLLAVVTAETNPRQGEILAAWAAMSSVPDQRGGG